MTDPLTPEEEVNLWTVKAHRLWTRENIARHPNAKFRYTALLPILDALDALAAPPPEAGLREALDGGSPRPWHVHNDDDADCPAGRGLYVHDARDEPVAFASSANPEDTALIVAAVNALPVSLAIIDEVSRD